VTDTPQIWRGAKSILLPYEGSASQLYVLDMPGNTLEATIDEFAKFVSDPTVVTLDSYTGAPQPMNVELRAKLLSSLDKSTTHQISGTHNDGISVSLYTWLDSSAGSFDAEIVFWADQLFPDPDDDPACLQVFGQFIDLAESIRENSSQSQCVISATEAGDPRNERNKPWTYWW